MKCRRKFFLVIGNILCITGLIISCNKETAIRIATDKLRKDTSYYKNFIPHPPDELTFKLYWSMQNELQRDTTLFMANVDIFAPYSADIITSVKAHQYDSTVIDIPEYDANLSQELFYKIEPRKLRIYKYFFGPPLNRDFKNFDEALYEIMVYTKEHTGFEKIRVKFNL